MDDWEPSTVFIPSGVSTVIDLKDLILEDFESLDSFVCSLENLSILCSSLRDSIPSFMDFFLLERAASLRAAFAPNSLILEKWALLASVKPLALLFCEPILPPSFLRR
jgi:hypothetical protein